MLRLLPTTIPRSESHRFHIDAILETYCRSYDHRFVIHLILYSRVLLINAVALYTVIKKLKHFITKYLLFDHDASSIYIPVL